MKHSILNSIDNAGTTSRESGKQWGYPGGLSMDGHLTFGEAVDEMGDPTLVAMGSTRSLQDCPIGDRMGVSETGVPRESET